jgi:transposase-like protein
MDKWIEADVLRARRRRDRAEEEYFEALETALESGATYADLGRVLGVSRQAVHAYVEKRRKR